MEFDRREILALAGTIATGAATAGCLGALGSDDEDDETDTEKRERPDYARWLPAAPDADGTGFAYVDWATLERVGEAEEDLDFGDGFDEDSDDPLVALPMIGAFVAVAGATWSLPPYGLAGLLEERDDAEAAAFDAEVAEVLWVEDALVVRGRFDTEEIVEALTTDGVVSPAFERTDGIGEYDVYTSSESDDWAVAVADDALVCALAGDLDGGPVEAIRRPIETAAGDLERAHEDSADFAWALASAGHGHIAFGGYGDPLEEADAGEDEEFPELRDARALVASLSVGEREATGEFAAAVADPDEDALEASLGASAADASLTVEGDRVTASATWTEMSDE